MPTKSKDIAFYKKKKILQQQSRISIMISNCPEICNSPLNNSTAKMMFSFPKQVRFAKRRQILCDKLYSLRSTADLRSAAFGFGDKYDFTKNALCSPSPNMYTPNDQFVKNVKKGFGFGKGREEMEITGPFMASRKNKNPGPDSYTLPSMLQKKTYSIRPKLNTFESSNKTSPGPGNYPATFSINQNGNYFLAKHKTVMVLDFGKSAGRCQTSQQKSPGPGSYTIQGVDLSPKGKYISSKLHNCFVTSFPYSERKFLGNISNTPGVGSYRLPSEFGYYESGSKFSKIHRQQTVKIDSQSSFARKQISNMTAQTVRDEEKEQNLNPKNEQNENRNLPIVQ